MNFQAKNFRCVRIVLGNDQTFPGMLFELESQKVTIKFGLFKISSNEAFMYHDSSKFLDCN